ncbi:hypothetical protein AB6E39_14255 [Vibrio splendidus]|jgi:hypothetical protein|uniref:hypothetical protein n=1 Tax=Vibrio TaxID=662 RepID=UPI000C82169E|nr:MULTISPECIES: hypothetical protein [Vibrio]MCC4789085.1 hypothetical protein [Vibrio splendidus]PMN37542.1 hypothetical protein BCT34_06225 [Vibrio sp. 10N.261.45.E2]PMN47272.1 hypothetical protein BCT32_09785 [Vibrio sp. 10N.261.45.E11]CAK2044763.1 membrane hypothetical protein [Vibrio crassostreae]
MKSLFKPTLMIFVGCMYALFFVAHQKKFTKLFGESFSDFTNDMHNKMPYFGMILTVFLGAICVFGGVLLSLWMLLFVSSWGVLAPDTYTESDLDPQRRTLPALLLVLSGYWVASLYISS